jgi:hypothetical protein
VFSTLQEDQNINATQLYRATSLAPGDRLGEIAAQLEKQAGRGRGRGRGRGNYGGNGSSNNNNNNQQKASNFRGPAQQ